ncbi:hypothetical protein HK102_013516, partial [Quaeritorhiza haematococci]
MQPLRTLFSKRTFTAVALDENNKFQFLPSLVRPIRCSNPTLETPGDLALAVGSIPYRSSIVPYSETSISHCVRELTGATRDAAFRYLGAKSRLNSDGIPHLPPITKDGNPDAEGADEDDTHFHDESEAAGFGSEQALWTSLSVAGWRLGMGSVTSSATYASENAYGQ